MTSIDNLAAEIMQGLQEYADLADTAMKKAVRKNRHASEKTRSPPMLRRTPENMQKLGNEKDW